MEFDWKHRSSGHLQEEKQPLHFDTIQKPLLAKTPDIERGLQYTEYSWKDHVSVITLLGHPPSGRCKPVWSIVRGTYAFLICVGIPVVITVVEYHSHELNHKKQVLHFRLFVRIVEALLGGAAYTCLWTVFHYDPPHIVLGATPVTSYDVDWERGRSERQSASLETRKRSLLQERNLSFSAPRESIADVSKPLVNSSSRSSSQPVPRYWKPPRKSFILLGALLILLTVLQGIWRSQKLQKKFWYIIVLSPIAFIFQVSNFILGCVIFWIICKKLTARLQNLSEIFVKKASVGASALLRELEIHKIIVSETHTLSYRFRAFVLSSTILGLVDIFVSLYVVIEQKKLVDLSHGGDLIFSNCVAFLGLVILLRAAAKITHQSKRLSTAFSSAHARITAERTVSFMQIFHSPSGSDLNAQRPAARNGNQGKRNAVNIPMKTMEKSSPSAAVDASEKASSSGKRAESELGSRDKLDQNAPENNLDVEFQWAGSLLHTPHPSFSVPVSENSPSDVDSDKGSILAKLGAYSLEYQTRTAILMHLDASKAGFSLYGFLVDRTFIQYMCAVLMTLTTFVSTQALIPR